MPQIQIAYALNTDVLIREIETKGRVRNIQISCDGIAYKVTYWMNGKHEFEWFDADELDPCTK